MKQLVITVLCAFCILSAASARRDNKQNKVTMEALQLTSEWDKTFPKSDKVTHSKVTFPNRYGITLAADLYVPKGASTPLPAIAVCGPFGAVNTQIYSDVPFAMC